MMSSSGSTAAAAASAAATKAACPGGAAVERGFGLCDPARKCLGAADADARLRDHAVLEPEGRERHGERKIAGAAVELVEAEAAYQPAGSAAAPR